MKISIFKSVARTLSMPLEMPWEEFAEEHLTKFDFRTEKDGPLFSFAIYDKLKRSRADINVIGLSGAILDFDNAEGEGKNAVCIANPTVPPDIENELDGITYAVYSSFSNSEAWPRWRLAIPFDREVKTYEWRAVFEGLLFKLGRLDGIDPSCGDLSRCYWLPSCPPNMQDFAFAGLKKGAYISADALIEDSGIILEAPLEVPATNGIHVPSSNGSGANGLHSAPGRNNKLKSIVAAMLDRQEPLTEILKEVLETDAKHNPPLFTDFSEGYNFGAGAGAMRFVGNVVRSINSTRTKRGKPAIIPAEPLIAEVGSTAEKGKKPVTYKALPDFLYKPPGLVGETFNYILNTSPKPQPELSLAAAFLACGTVMGRKIRTDTNLRTALYFLSLIETGGGKDGPRKAVQRLFSEAGCFKRAETEDVTGDTAILEATGNSPSCILLIDEFGRWIRQATNANSNPQLYAAVSLILRLYSSASGPFMAKAYADRKKNRLIQQPNVSILATSVERNFYNAITSEAAEDGLLNRVMLLISNDPDPIIRPIRNFDPPETLVEQFKAWEKVGYRQDGNLATVETNNELPPQPRIVPFSKEARALFDDLESDLRKRRADLRKEKLAGLFTRVSENAQRMALVLAAGQDIAAPQISYDDALYAATFVLTCAENTLLAVKNHVSDTKLEQQHKAILNFIREGGEAGTSLHDIGRKTKGQLKKRERTDILDDLESMGIIGKRVDTSGSKRPKLIYFYLGEEPETNNAPVNGLSGLSGLNGLSGN